MNEFFFFLFGPIIIHEEDKKCIWVWIIFITNDQLKIFDIYTILNDFYNKYLISKIIFIHANSNDYIFDPFY